LFSAWTSNLWIHILGVKWKVSFDKPVDTSKAYIVVCNHQSALDVFGMMQASHEYLFKVKKKDQGSYVHSKLPYHTHTCLEHFIVVDISTSPFL
jgi:hypothetical protein